MLQEIAYDRADVNGLRNSGDARLQAADPSNQKIDFYARMGSLIQCLYDIRVAQGIHLGADKCLFTCLGILSLTLDHIKETVLHPDRSDQQAEPFLRLRITGEHVENGRRIRSYLRIACKDAAVCVQLCSGIIVVTGSEMYISANTILLTADHHRDLAVNFKSEQTVNNMAAGFLKHFRPNNVMFLVKTGLQLYEDRDLLAALCGTCQSRNDRRISAHTVQGLFDGQYIRIRGSFLNETYDRIETHIWVMYKDVFSSDHFKYIVRVGKFPDRCRCISLRLICIESRKSVNFHQECQIDRSGNIEYVLLRYIEFLNKDFQKPFIDALSDLKSNNFTPLALLKLFLDFFQKILSLVLIHIQFRVPHDAIRISAEHSVMLEKLTDIFADDFFEQNDDFVPVFRIGKVDQSRKYSRHLHGREFERLFLLLGFLLGNQSTDIESLVADKRERTGRVHRHRCEDRINTRLKVFIEICALRFCKFLIVGNDLQSGFLKGRDKRTVQRIVLISHKCMHSLGNCTELFGRCHPRNVFFGVSGMDLILQGGHADHIEFIQIRCSDTEELCSLEQRNQLPVSCFRETSLVERYPRQLAVPVVFRISEIDLRLIRHGDLYRFIYGGFLLSHRLCFRQNLLLSLYIAFLITLFTLIAFRCHIIPSLFSKFVT